MKSIIKLFVVLFLAIDLISCDSDSNYERVEVETTIVTKYQEKKYSAGQSLFWDKPVYVDKYYLVLDYEDRVIEVQASEYHKLEAEDTYIIKVWKKKGE